MAARSGPKSAANKRYTKLWGVVKRLIIQHYDALIKRSMRGSYYIVGDLLAPLIGKEITLEDYNWYGTDQGYASYRDDVWTYMEQKYGLSRPEAAPIGVVYENGREHPITKLEEAWDRARGFIFVEKADEAKDISPLSEYGWTVVAGKGYPLRLVRKLLKEDARPVLVLHDYDRDGMGIYRALGFETRRTKHLGIALGERVIDLGLTEEHVKALNLPARPSPPKYKGKPRVELSGLAVLSTRMGLENPVLAYTAASMLAKDLKLSPTEIPKRELLARHLRWALTEGLMRIAGGVAEEVAKEMEMEGNEAVDGTAVEGVLDSSVTLEVEGLREELRAFGREVAEKIRWRREEEVHEEAVERFTSGELVRILGRPLNA